MLRRQFAMRGAETKNYYIYYKIVIIIILKLNIVVVY